MTTSINNIPKCLGLAHAHHSPTRTHPSDISQATTSPFKQRAYILNANYHVNNLPALRNRTPYVNQNS